MTVRVVLIDDHPVVRAGLRALIEGACDMVGSLTKYQSRNAPAATKTRYGPRTSRPSM